MNNKLMLHILRNPFGWSEQKKREAALAAANEIEELQKAYEKLKDWAEEKGLDVTTYG